MSNPYAPFTLGNPYAPFGLSLSKARGAVPMSDSGRNPLSRIRDRARACPVLDTGVRVFKAATHKSLKSQTIRIS